MKYSDLHVDTPTVLAFASKLTYSQRQELVATISSVKPTTRTTVLSNIEQFLCFPAMAGFD